MILDGATRMVRCQVRSISGFSAHADDSELIDWLRHLAAAPRKPRRVFLVHGDPDGEAALVPGVRALGLEPYRPAWREEVAARLTPSVEAHDWLRSRRCPCTGPLWVAAGRWSISTPELAVDHQVRTEGFSRRCSDALG